MNLYNFKYLILVLQLNNSKEIEYELKTSFLDDYLLLEGHIANNQ